MKRPLYILALRHDCRGKDDDVRVLRVVLKRLLRQYGFRCESLRRDQ